MYEKDAEYDSGTLRHTSEEFSTLAGALERMTMIEEGEVSAWLQTTWVDGHIYYDEANDEWVLEYDYDPSLYEEAG